MNKNENSHYVEVSPGTIASGIRQSAIVGAVVHLGLVVVVAITLPSLVVLIQI